MVAYKIKEQECMLVTFVYIIVGGKIRVIQLERDKCAIPHVQDALLKYKE